MLEPTNEEDRITPDSPVSKVVRYSLGLRLEPVIHYLSMAANGSDENIENVHRLRVATRRSIASIHFFRKFLPRKKRRWFLRKLDRIRRVAGNARDLDVMASRLSNEPNTSPAGCMQVLRRYRKESQQPILRCFDTLFHRGRFETKVRELIDSASMQGIALQSYERWSVTRANRIVSRFLSSIPEDTGDLASLHHFRIRIKSLRYRLELLMLLYPPEQFTHLIGPIEVLQSKLGRINDLATSVSLLTKWSRGLKSKRERNGVKKQLEVEREQLTRFRKQFVAWWTPAQKKKLRKSLKRIVDENPLGE